MERLYSRIRKYKLSTRFAMLFNILLAFWLANSGFAIYALRDASTKSQTTFETRVVQLEVLDKINESFERVRNNSKMVYIAATTDADFESAITEYNQAKETLLQSLTEYSDWLNNWDGATQYDMELNKSVAAKIDAALDYMDRAVNFCNDTNTATLAVPLMVSDEAVKANDDASDAVMQLFSHNMETSLTSNKDNVAYADQNFKRVIIGALGGLFIVGIVFMLMANAISRPIRKLQAYLAQIAVGNFDVNAPTKNEKDEIAALTHDIGKVVHIFQSMSNDMLVMGSEFEKGDTEHRINLAQYNGIYKDVVLSINSLLDSIMHDLSGFLNCMIQFGEGDFNADIEQLPGKKITMNQTINKLRENLEGVNKDITYLVSHAQAGDLTAKVDAERYKGDWAVLISSLNDLLHSVYLPINEATECISTMAKGDFSKYVQGNYNGCFDVIKTSLNSTMHEIGNYISEISKILYGISHNNLNQEIQKSYVGDFVNIKESLNLIVDTLNNFMVSIGDAAMQVAGGSRQISQNSTALADGAYTQSSSIDMLNNSLSVISKQIQKNSHDANDANNLVAESRNHAQRSNEQMQQMLTSMDEMKEASSNISKIIKVIEDIAFQTNLLALNAAVEAARAGEHGKGFAVVAEEVRNLAARSQSAAKDTTDLINDTISKIGNGTLIANSTGESLNTIVKDFNAISSIISRLADSALEQSSSIEKFSENLDQISDVIQRNTSASEEAASASEELSNQSETLQNMISVYTLKPKNK